MTKTNNFRSQFQESTLKRKAKRSLSSFILPGKVSRLGSKIEAVGGAILVVEVVEAAS